MVMSTCAGVDEHYLDRVVESVKKHEEHVDVHVEVVATQMHKKKIAPPRCRCRSLKICTTKDEAGLGLLRNFRNARLCEPLGRFRRARCQNDQEHLHNMEVTSYAALDLRSRKSQRSAGFCG